MTKSDTVASYLTKKLQRAEAEIGRQTQEISTLRAALASAQADYEELKRVTKLLQLGHRSGRKR